MNSRWMVLVLTLMLLPLWVAGAESALLYRQDFNSLNAATSDDLNPPAAVNAELAKVNWTIFSVAQWGVRRVQRVEDAGGGNMVVTAQHMTGNTGGAPQADIMIHTAAPFPAYRNVIVTGYVGWDQSPGTYDKWVGPGVVFRANSLTGASGSSTFSGNFYFVRLIDLNDPGYGTDTMQLTRVISGVESNLAGIVTWKNGYSNFNDPTRRACYLQVVVDNVDTNVQIQATWSKDATFKDPASVILVGSWIDGSSDRITTGGSVGYAQRSLISIYNQMKFTWDVMQIEKKQGGTVVFIR